MTFINSTKKVLLLLGLIILSINISIAKKLSSNSSSKTKEFKIDELKKYYEMALDMPKLGDPEKRCWEFIFGAGLKDYKSYFENIWTTIIEPFKNSPSTVNLDLYSNFSKLTEKVDNNVVIDPTKGTETCKTYLESKRKTTLTPEDIKKGAMIAFNIVVPAKLPGPTLFVTSAVSTHRDSKLRNPDVFKILNGNKSG